MAFKQQMQGLGFAVVPIFMGLTGCAPNGQADCSQGCDSLVVRLCGDQLIDRKTGGQIRGRVDNYSALIPKQLTLYYKDMDSQFTVQDIDVFKLKLSEKAPMDCSIADSASQNSRYFTIDIQPQVAMAFGTVPYDAKLTLKYVDVDESGIGRVRREAEAGPVGLRSFFRPVPLMASAVQPTIEGLGFTGDRLLSLRAADEAMTLKKRFGVYSLTADLLTPEIAPTGFVFANALPTALPTAAFAAGRVVWLELVAQSTTGQPLGMALQSCPVTATDKADCANPASPGYPNNLLPIDYKAFAVSPTADRAAVVLADGTLRTAALPTQSMNPSPLAWSIPAGQPAVARNKTVRLATGDLNADGRADLVVLHQDASGQDVSVYLGQAAGGDWQYDAMASAAWGRAFAGPAVTALALGDLDRDGRAEVAIGGGVSLSLWQTTSDATAPFRAWSSALPAAAGTVGALAIGRTKDGGSQALVVASATAPDGLGHVEQFLHAFLPQ